MERRACDRAGLGLTTAPYLPGVNVPSPNVSFSIETPTDARELRAYQQNMIAVVRKNPELFELIKQRSELVKRYLAARRDQEIRRILEQRPAFDRR